MVVALGAALSVFAASEAGAQTTTQCNPSYGGGFTCNTTTPPALNWGLMNPPRNTAMEAVNAFEAGRRARDEREAIQAQIAANEQRLAQEDQRRAEAERVRSEWMRALLQGGSKEKTPEEAEASRLALEQLRTAVPGGEDWRSYAPPVSGQKD